MHTFRLLFLPQLVLTRISHTRAQISLNDCGKNKKGVRSRNRSAPPWSVVTGLEGEAGSELGCERPRQQAARGIDEADGLAKRGALDHVIEVIAVIGVVEEVEPLER